jgi:hypothetical protein
MVDKDIKERIKHLPPEERLKMLKSAQEIKRKKLKEAEERLVKLKEAEEKEIEEAEQQIRKEEEDIARDRKILEELEQMDIPDVAEVDIDKLFEAATIDDHFKDIGKAPLIPSAEQYRIGHEPMQDLYERVKDIKHTVDDKGYMTQEQKDEIEYVSHAIQYKEKDIRSGEYKTTTDRLEDIMGSTKSIIQYLRSG